MAEEKKRDENQAPDLFEAAKAAVEKETAARDDVVTTDELADALIQWVFAEDAAIDMGKHLGRYHKHGFKKNSRCKYLPNTLCQKMAKSTENANSEENTDNPAQILEEEFKEVVKRHTDKDGKKKPSWMMAPNGKPTHLTERQWVLARTPSFKDEFGDWEIVATAKKILEEDSIVAEGTLLRMEAEEQREAAAALYREIKNRGPIETSDGRFVEFSGRGFREIRHHSADPHTLALVEILPEVIATMYRLRTDPPKRDEANVKACHTYARRVNLGDGEMVAKIVIREHRTGNLFYDEDSTRLELLKNIYEKGTSEPTTRGPNTSSAQKSPFVENSLADIFANVKSTKDDCAKKVDENGEPKPEAFVDKAWFQMLDNAMPVTTDELADIFLAGLGLDGGDIDPSDPDFWEKHDRQHHHGHFDPETQSCSLREEAKEQHSIEELKDKADDIGNAGPDETGIPDDARKEALEEAKKDEADDIGAAQPEVQEKEEPEKVEIPDLFDAAVSEMKEKGDKEAPEKSIEELDAEYMEAVERGDTDACSEMLQEAFGKRFGKISPYVKESDSEKPRFFSRPSKPNRLGWCDAWTQLDDLAPDGDSVFFNLKNVWGPADGYQGEPYTEDMLEYAAKNFCDTMKKAGVNLNSANIIANFPRVAIEDFDLRTLVDEVGNEQFEKAMRKLGYDGFAALVDDRKVTAFDKSAIVPAAPVMRDADGDVIPLSKRFQEGNSDIRYSKHSDGTESWDAEARAQVEDTAKALRNALGGVTVEISDEAYRGNSGDDRLSISGIFTGSSADYANRSRLGGIDDGPSLKKIGSGEGEQVYGWGLYGSSIRNVADIVASMGHETEIRKDGINNLNDVEREAAARISANMSLGSLAEAIEESIFVTREDRDYFSSTGDKAAMSREDAILRELLDHGSEYKADSKVGNIYEQTWFINRPEGDESHLLSWDAPISDTNISRINKQLKDEGIDVQLSGGGYELIGSGVKPMQPNGNEYRRTTEKPPSGREIYSLLTSRIFGSEAATSKFLNRADIDGIKYPVDLYGKEVKDEEAAGWNYVAFSDKNIRVDHKWIDGEQRYFKNPEGKIVGKYDRNSGKITLYPGAKVSDVVHEFSHGLWQYAEQEASTGNNTLQKKIREIAESAPKVVKDAVKANYPDASDTVYLEECFTHEIARRSDTAFAKAIETKEGKPWYKRAWGAIKDTWKGFAQKHGMYNADVSKMKDMNADESAKFILKNLVEGRRFGDVQHTGEGVRQSIIGMKGAANLGIGKRDEAEDMEKSGASREDIWRKTGWWKGKDGKWRVEIPDVKLPFEQLPSVEEYLKTYRRMRQALDKVNGSRAADLEFLAPEEYNAWQDGRKRTDELSEAEKMGKYTIRDFVSGTGLESAYPSLMDIPVKFVPHTESGLGNTLGETIGGSWDGEKILVASDATPERMRSIIAHEIQHAIQAQEGFARGGDLRRIHEAREKNRKLTAAISDMMERTGYRSWMDSMIKDGSILQNSREAQDRWPNSKFSMMRLYADIVGGYSGRRMMEKLEEADSIYSENAKEAGYGVSEIEAYQNRGGEVESRNVQRRLDMTPEERASTPPWETEDVPEDKQIVVRGKSNQTTEVPDLFTTALAEIDGTTAQDEAPVTTDELADIFMAEVFAEDGEVDMAKHLKRYHKRQRPNPEGLGLRVKETASPC